MRKLLWLGRIGLVTLALVLLPTGVQETRLSSALLCAAQSDANGNCKEETGSYCLVDGVYLPDYTSKS